MLIVDETAGEKSSAEAVGAVRQYSGTVGSVTYPVTLTCATGRGYMVTVRALYLPEGCAADEKHRELAGVPEEVPFATKPQLAAGQGIRLKSWHRWIAVCLPAYISPAVAMHRLQEASSGPGRQADPGHRPGAAAAARHRHPAPQQTGPTGCNGQRGDAATSTEPAKPVNVGIPRPRQHHHHNELQMPYVTAMRTPWKQVP
jgi:hypothetical protein